MGLSIWHILLVLVVVLVIFGAGKLPNVMGDLGKGIRSFKSGLSGDDKPLDKTEKPQEKAQLPPSDKSV
jgi:sec-independent protein translocase protein TatA